MKTQWIMMAALSLLAAAGCDIPDKDIGDETMGASGTPGDTCEPGDTVPAADGCNTCECGEDGTLACTEIACPPDDVDCEPGEEFPAGDGCNTCFCEADGSSTCTLIDCGPVGCTPGETVPNPGECGVCTCSEDGEVVCTEGDCGDDPFASDALAECGPGTSFDPLLSVDAVSLEGDLLSVDVSSGGGCEMHLFGGCWDGAFLESEPVQVGIEIAHEDNGDTCEAIITETVEIDLTPLREAYIAGYGGEGGTIDISLQGWSEAIAYSF